MKLKVGVLLVVSILAGCASLETDDDVKMTELQRAIKSKERGDVFYCSGRNRSTMNCAYMTQWEVQQRMRNMGLY
jgi:esterase/lipase superfamily enzyme